MDVVMAPSLMDQDGSGAGAAGQQQQLQPSRHFLAAAVKRCRWLPCAPADLVADDGQPAEGAPAALALWSADVQGHILAVGDIVRQAGGGGEMLGFADKLAVPHSGGFTDLTAARLGDAVVAAAAGSEGRVRLLAMQLPGAPGATSADLQMPAVGDGGGSGSPLLELPWAHRGPASSVDISGVTRSVLSVGLDGCIYIAPADSARQQQQGEQAGSRQQQQTTVAPFRQGTGYSGYSQGRWVDSNTFVTTGLVGGLQLWDARRPGAAGPAAAAPKEWGRTGAPAADAAAAPGARQLHCLAVHPSRPNLAATGGSGGTVAVWDLRMAAAPAAAAGLGGGGDVWEVRFDPLDAYGAVGGSIGGGIGGGGAALPPLLFCLASGELCRAAAAGKGGGGLVADVLLAEACSVNSFDADGATGDLMAVTDFEGLVFAARGGRL